MSCLGTLRGYVLYRLKRLCVLCGRRFPVCSGDISLAGFFYMTAFGDPQKQNIARGALVGAFVGVCIMGVSFLAPRIMSQFVLEPAGLEGVNQAGNTGCDRTLGSVLITQRGVGNAKQANSMVRAIQAQRASDCNAEIWNPYVIAKGTPPGGTAITADTGFTALRAPLQLQTRLVIRLVRRMCLQH